MTNFLKKHLDISLIQGCFAFALIYCLMFNSIVFFHNFQNINGVLLEDILRLCKEFIGVNIFLFIMFFGLSVHRLVFAVGSLLLFVCGALASYYLFTDGTIPALDSLAENFDFMNAKLIAWMLFSLGIYLYLIQHFKVQVSNLFFTKILSAICLFIFVINIIEPQYNVIKGYFPIEFLSNNSV